MDGLSAALARAIADEAERLREAAIKKAVADFEAELREAVGRAAFRVADYYEVARNQNNLVITVRLNG